MADRAPRRTEADFAALRCPTAFTVGSHGPCGASEQDARTLRAAVAKAVAGNPHVTVFGTAPSSHFQILDRDPGIVVAAISEASRWSARVTHR